MNFAAAAQRLAASLALIVTVALGARMGFAWSQVRKMAPQALGVVPFQNEAGNIAASQQSSVGALTAQFFVTMLPFLLVVSVKLAVWLVNDPLREPAVKAV